MTAATRPAAAAADMMGMGMAPYHRFKLGGFEVTTLLAGTRTVPDPQTIFGLSTPPEDFAAAAEAAFIPTDRAQFFFTPTVVNTGTELVLFDTGLNPDGTRENDDKYGHNVSALKTARFDHDGPSLVSGG
mgnify:CR=1 FL=1